MFSEACRGGAKTLPNMDFSQYRALIAEDNDFVRYMVRKHLIDFGFKEVLEASNGTEAMQLLMRRPDIIICDIGMEPMNGYEFLEHVRSAGDAQGSLPFIFLTGNAEEAAVQKAIDMKVNAYILKPVTPDALLRKVTALLTKAATA